ncbi:MAG TPA: hemolysin III family protein, partial [Corynebacterium pollutisoli]|nr:hemolysin III family protein [Corynebacterium pollutisoli]
MVSETITLTREVFNRGPRPVTRGWFHFFAALASVIGGSVLSTYAWMTLAWGNALGVTVY